MTMQTFLLTLLLCCLQTSRSARNMIVFHGNVPSNLYLNTAHGPTEISNREGRSGDSRIIRLHLYPADKRSKAPKLASVVINSGAIQGTITLTQVNPPLGTTIIRGRLSGLNPGTYAINVFSLGDMKGGCDTIGEVYNPYTLSKEWQPYQRYMGDLGTIEVGELGIAEIFIDDPFVSLVGPRAIVGRALALTDVQVEENLQDIEVNRRVACGVIGYAS